MAFPCAASQTSPPRLPACSQQSAPHDQLQPNPRGACRPLHTESNPSPQFAALAMGIVSNIVVQGVVTFVILGSLKRAGVVK